MSGRSSVSFQCFQVPDHDGERFFFSTVPLPHVRELVQGAAQVHPAPALGHADPALVQVGRELGDRIPVVMCTMAVQEIVAGTAYWAGHRLMMETSGVRVAVFLLTLRAQWERPHGRLVPIVRQVLDHGEARAAVGAVGERVKVTPVGRIEHLLQARIADGRVVRYPDAPGALLAGDDLESHGLQFSVRKAREDGHLIQTGQGRQRLFQPENELLGVPVHFYDNVGTVVLHVTVKAHGPRQAMDRRPETDPLDHSPHGYAHAPFHPAPDIYSLSVPIARGINIRNPFRRGIA